MSIFNQSQKAYLLLADGTVLKAAASVQRVLLSVRSFLRPVLPDIRKLLPIPAITVRSLHRHFRL